MKILNDWTAGKLWNNLLLVKGRTKFDFHDVENRFKNGNSVFQQKDTTYFTNLLYKRAIAEEHWTKKSIGKFIQNFLQNMIHYERKSLCQFYFSAFMEVSTIGKF